MWDLLFNPFPPPLGRWQWRWYRGTFKCTRVLFTWETIKPEALLQLSLPRAILPRYSRGNHTSIYTTRHAWAHTSDGERERERKRKDRIRNRDCLETQRHPVVPLYSKCLRGKLLEWNTVHPGTPWFRQTKHTTCMLLYLKSSLDFPRLQWWRDSSYVGKAAKQRAELINNTATKTQNTWTSTCIRQPKTFTKKLFVVYLSSQKGNVSTKTRSARNLAWWWNTGNFLAQTLHFGDWDEHRGRSLSLRFSTEIPQS